MGKTTVELIGVKRFTKKLEKHRVNINRVTNIGLREAAELVKRETLAITPEDKGNLKASIVGGREGLIIKTPTGSYTEVGWKNHPYAVHVHEALGIHYGKGTPRWNGNGNMWDIAGQPKFLEKTIFRHWRKIKKLIVKKRVL